MDLSLWSAMKIKISRICRNKNCHLTKKNRFFCINNEMLYEFEYSMHSMLIAHILIPFIRHIYILSNYGYSSLKDWSKSYIYFLYHITYTYITYIQNQYSFIFITQAFFIIYMTVECRIFWISFSYLETVCRLVLVCGNIFFAVSAL